MHTQRKHARQVEAAGAFFIFTIGENQPLLFEAAGALPWESVAGEAWTVDRGHGRVNVRTIKTLPPTGRIAALFPHVRQVFLVERYSYGTDGTLLGAVAVLGITSLPADQAGPADLLAYLRGHWAIEMHHYVRDVCLGEDASRIGRAHRAMAAVRQASCCDASDGRDGIRDGRLKCDRRRRSRRRARGDNGVAVARVVRRAYGKGEVVLIVWARRPGRSGDRRSRPWWRG